MSIKARISATELENDLTINFITNELGDLVAKSCVALYCSSFRSEEGDRKTQA